MTRKLLTVDEFRGLARDDETGDCTVVRLAVADPITATDGSRKVRFVFSDATVDRAGDSIDPKGWQTATFLANPVALWAHDSSSPPIGRASNVAAVNGKLMGDIEFMPADISPFADSIYKMVSAGYVKAVSVGFMPLDWKFSKDKDRPFGIDFTKQELLEISVCPVPCNPNALQEAKAAGIDTSPIREWASKLLDDGSQVLVPRDTLEKIFNQAKISPAHQLRKKLLKSTDWRVGVAYDLPIDDLEDWDAAAAAKRMLDAAGFDGDTPSVSKAARGFLIYDAANPSDRSSYKLPFADIVDGELKAVKSAIGTAKGRINQIEAPSSVLDEAQSVIDGYEAKMGDDNDIVVPEKESALEKSGRTVSNANAALLNKALEHHDSAMKCIKEVLGSNTPADDPDNDNDTDPVNTPDDDKPIVMMTEADKRAQRLAEAKAMKASVKL